MNLDEGHSTLSGSDDRWFRIFALASGIVGCAAVILGALGAHLFRERLELHDGLANYQLAKQYLFVHALALGGVALLMRVQPSRWAKLAGWCFLFGIAAFPGSLLVISLTGWRAAGNAAPFGGISLMAGWLLWGISGARRS